MSKPGAYSDAELTVVDKAGSRLARAYAPSWLAAVRDLTAAFGFAPRITVTNGEPIGAYRTRAQQQAVSPGTSPDLSDHCKGRAVDITNQRAFRTRDQARFLRILADHGWKNVNTSGHSFPSEPWHFANQSATPAGAGTLIEDKEPIMATNWVDTSTYKNGRAAKGTQCMTTWEGGPLLEYQRDPADATETAKIMTAKYGPHQELNHAQYLAVKAAFTPQGGGTTATVQLDAEAIALAFSKAIPSFTITGTAAPAK